MSDIEARIVSSRQPWWETGGTAESTAVPQPPPPLIRLCDSCVRPGCPDACPHMPESTGLRGE